MKKQNVKVNYTKLPRTLKNYDKESNIWRHVNNLNLTGNENLQGNKQKFNRFLNGLRVLESNLVIHIDENERKKLNEIKEKYKKVTTIQDKVELAFQKMDILMYVLGDKLIPAEYSSIEAIQDEW